MQGVRVIDYRPPETTGVFNNATCIRKIVITLYSSVHGLRFSQIICWQIVDSAAIFCNLVPDVHSNSLINALVGWMQRQANVQLFQRRLFLLHAIFLSFYFYVKQFNYFLNTIYSTIIYIIFNNILCNKF